MTTTHPEVTVDATPYVGQAATINLYTDTHAAVVVRVNRKSISVARVATGEARPDMAADEGAHGIRPTIAEGILDQIAGEPMRYPLVGTRYRDGSITITLGRSVTRIDHRY